MARYRKKPVEIDAVQWDGTADGATPIIDWILEGGATATYVCSNPDRCAENDGDTPHRIEIRTLEGTMSADLDDWIIRGVQGEFYPCKPGIFAATYEAVASVPASTEADTTTRAFAALHRSAEQDVTRVIDLYEQWVKAGPPPLGTPVSRWWDARLVELHDAIRPRGDQGIAPDFTSPIAGRIEVRQPCPHCGDQQMVPRTQFAEHVARLHPDADA